MEDFKPESFFDIPGLACADLIGGHDFVWEILDHIKTYITQKIKPNVAAIRRHGDLLTTTHVIWNDKIITSDLTLRHGDPTKGEFTVMHRGDILEGATVIYAGACLMDDDIELSPGVVIEPGALIKGPTMVGERTEVRQGAYIRGDCYIGRSCVVGHATEMKNAVMLDQAKAGHFAYLGDSILGRNTNLGAGTKLANLKIMPWPIKFTIDDQNYRVERRKFGAILGDRVETGCNTVTSPGTIMGVECLVAANMTVPSGYHPPRTFVRMRLPKKHGSRPQTEN